MASVAYRLYESTRQPELERLGQCARGDRFRRRRCGKQLGTAQVWRPLQPLPRDRQLRSRKAVCRGSYNEAERDKPNFFQGVGKENVSRSFDRLAHVTTDDNALKLHHSINDRKSNDHTTEPAVKDVEAIVRDIQDFDKGIVSSSHEHQRDHISDRERPRPIA